MLPRSCRLSIVEFNRAFAACQTLRHPLLTLRVHRRSEGTGFEEEGEISTEKVRAAFVVPKKLIKKAAVRNAIRRQMREAFRLHAQRDVLQGCDLIFMATAQTQKASRHEFNAALSELLGRASRKIRPPRGEVNTSNEDGHPARYSLELDGMDRQNAFEKRPTILPVTWIVLSLIRFYQRFISPSVPPSCRFSPSCSHYTLAAIERFGLGRGAILGAARICRCQPFCKGGFDPVPKQFSLFPLPKPHENPSKSPLQRRFLAFFGR